MNSNLHRQLMAERQADRIARAARSARTAESRRNRQTASTSWFVRFRFGAAKPATA